MDSGCSYGGYCSDVTRTWPVNGTFTPAQKDLYEAVLAVQKHCINVRRVRDAFYPSDQAGLTPCTHAHAIISSILIV